MVIQVLDCLTFTQTPEVVIQVLDCNTFTQTPEVAIQVLDCLTFAQTPEVVIKVQVYQPHAKVTLEGGDETGEVTRVDFDGGS